MEPELREGWVDAELAEEFPELRLVLRGVEAALGPQPARACKRAPARARRPHHRREGGAHAPGPRALGLPGVLAPGGHRPRQRPHAGRARSRSTGSCRAGCRAANLLDDALTIATLETGVPVVAFDARPGAAASSACGWPRRGERLGRERPLSRAPDRGRRRGAAAGGRARRGRRRTPGVTPATARMVLAALQVKGVPRISVEEALWTAGETARALTDRAG